MMLSPPSRDGETIEIGSYETGIGGLVQHDAVGILSQYVRILAGPDQPQPVGSIAADDDRSVGGQSQTVGLRALQVHQRLGCAGSAVVGERNASVAPPGATRKIVPSSFPQSPESVTGSVPASSNAAALGTRIGRPSVPREYTDAAPEGPTRATPAFPKSHAWTFAPPSTARPYMNPPVLAISSTDPSRPMR
jgi:hypothetical protein